MQVDTFSVTQNNKRTMSFMSQALGLMADLDLGTEHLRWMGDTRFMLGFLYGRELIHACRLLVLTPLSGSLVAKTMSRAVVV